MSAAKIVKRYANRKLYDTERSCYVTLDDIAVMIRSGEEVTAEAPFECSDLAGHGWLGHPQLACGSREASQPRSRVEDGEPVEATDRLDDRTYHAFRLCHYADLVAVQRVQAAAE